MIELYELNPHEMTTPKKKKRNVCPGSLRQNQMFRPSETTEVWKRPTITSFNSFMTQEIYGDRDSVSIQGEVGDQEHLKKTSSV